jgi:UrcA family protein
MSARLSSALNLFYALPFALLCTGIITSQAQQLDEVIVSAQRIVATSRVGQSSSGIPDELISISFRINYSDLDLTKSADINTLQSRLEAAARSGCAQLDKLYPFTPHEAPKCVKKALADSSAQLEHAIAAAKAKSNTQQ